MPLIQATQQLIEQQQTWPCGECPREQHKAALPVREFEQLPTLRAAGVAVHRIGDSKAPRSLLMATSEGYQLGLQL